MFVRSCFVLANTPELCKELESLGYQRGPCYEGNLPYLYVYDGTRNGLGPLYSEANYDAPILFHTNSGIIDCKGCVPLFLAVASMSDDPYGILDYYIVEKDCVSFRKGDVVRSLVLSSVIHPSCYRKATVQELFTHFGIHE